MLLRRQAAMRLRPDLMTTEMVVENSGTHRPAERARCFPRIEFAFCPLFC